MHNTRTASRRRRLAAWLTALSLGLPLAPAPAQAQAEPLRTPRQLIDKLGVEIRQLLAAPQSGRTPDDAERDAAEKIAALVRTSPGHLSLTQTDTQGNTPLMLAVSAGYVQVVQALLADPSVRLLINATNMANETPWMVASFAPAATLVACQPGTLTRERYTLLPPYLARMGYLLKSRGAALGAIVRTLEDAGAEPQPEAGRRAWLARCPNTSPELRDALKGDGDLLQTLVTHAVTRQREFNQAAVKAIDSLPDFPPEGTRFVTGTPEDRALHLPPLLQIQSMSCVTMAKPQLKGAIRWEGEVLLRVVASTRAGVIEAADIDALKVTGRRSDDVVPYFRASLLQALAGYECEGEHVFEQEFHFKID